MASKSLPYKYGKAKHGKRAGWSKISENENKSYQSSEGGIYFQSMKPTLGKISEYLRQRFV